MSNYTRNSYLLFIFMDNKAPILTALKRNVYLRLTRLKKIL